MLKKYVCFSSGCDIWVYMLLYENIIWIKLTQDCPVAGFCYRGNENVGFMKDGESNQIGHNELLKNYFA